jgi:hypothetical protein
MSTTVSINSKKLEPVQTVEINKTYNRREDGSPLSASYTISVGFTLVSDMGSPRSLIDSSLSNTGWTTSAPQNVSGKKYFWTLSGYAPRETITSSQRLAAIERKIEALRELFSNQTDSDGLLFEVQSESGDQPMKAVCKLENLVISPGPWVNYATCSIVLTTNRISINGATADEDSFDTYDYKIASASESWQLDTDEAVPESENRPRTYRIAHTMQAKGLPKYDLSTGAILQKPWEQARGYVHAVGGFYNNVSNTAGSGIPGFDSYFLTSSGVRDLPSYYVQANHVRSENIDRAGGTYQLTENWILASGYALEDFTVQTIDNIDNPLLQVSVNGTITGLDERDPINMSLIRSKFQNADSRLSGVVSELHNRAQSYSGSTLNVLPNNKTIGKNPNTGSITYQFDYDNRPTLHISGAKSEQITVGYSRPGRVVAIIPIIGRTNGPILQDIGTYTARRKTLSINAILAPQSVIDPVFPDISAILAAVTPTGSQVFMEAPEENLSLQGSYNYSVAFTYEV